MFGKNEINKMTKIDIKNKILELKSELAMYQAEDSSKKIQINGSFGKLGSKYSLLYAPDLLLQTTITGQLALLMLIERMEDAGIEIVSANTDGVVCYAPNSLLQECDRIAFDWELDTSYLLEETNYSKLASRDE